MLCVLDKLRVDDTLARKPIRHGVEGNWEHMYCNVWSCVLDESRVDDTLARGPLRRKES